MATDSRMRGDVLLIGSLPFGDAEEAFRATGPGLSGYASSLPDGEVGVRAAWVNMLPILVFSKHPGLQEDIAPSPDYSLSPSGRSDAPSEELPAYWTFRVKPGAQLEFEDLTYGRFAIDSYGVFRRLHDDGVIDSDVRFQVCLPSPNSAINSFFGEVSQWPAVQAAYLRGIRREIAKILEVVPASDLAIQFDVAWELVDLAMGNRNFFDFWPKLSFEEKFANHVAQLDEVWKGIPDETVLGYHWCYGNWGGWPMTAMEDLSICVRISNEAVRRSSRFIDYVNMPVVRQPDAGFFESLKQLNIGDTKVFLGMAHHGDSLDEFKQRMGMAKQSLPSFGIAGVCGYSGVNSAEMPEVMRMLREDADALSG